MPRTATPDPFAANLQALVREFMPDVTIDRFDHATNTVYYTFGNDREACSDSLSSLFHGMGEMAAATEAVLVAQARGAK